MNDNSMQHPILFFDASCPFCISCVAIFLLVDTNCRCFVAPLSGETAAQYLTWKFPRYRRLNTVIFLELIKDKYCISFRSKAMMRAFLTLGGLWNLLRIVYVFPTIPVADLLYRVVAVIRRRFPPCLFGKRTLEKFSSRILP